MPTNRTKRSRARRQKTEPWQIEFLKHGKVAESQAHAWEQYKFQHMESREAWKAQKKAIMAEWLREHPGTRPWGWWEYEAVDVDLGDEPEKDFLERHGLLTVSEKRALKKAVK